MVSDQQDVHPDLLSRIERHRQSRFQRPLARRSLVAFERAQQWLSAGEPRRIVLDAGCGTGASSRALAEQLPGFSVIGIDKSAARLERGRQAVNPPNLLLLRANLLDFYRLAFGAGWRCAMQKLYYPNPWPKAAQLNKRWYGSPVFAELVGLGGELELRCNWRLYAQEMRIALIAFGVSGDVVEIEPEKPISLFEAKYAASGHALWQLTADLSQASSQRGQTSSEMHVLT